MNHPSGTYILLCNTHTQNDTPVKRVLAEERREHHNLVLAGVNLLNAVDVMSPLLVTHKQDMTGSRLPGQVTDGAMCVVNHEVRSVDPLNLRGWDAGTEGDLLWLCLALLT